MTQFLSLDSIACSLSTKYNCKPKFAPRPFSDDRDGFVIAEGSCILILEALDTIKRSKIFGEIIGYGSTCDVYNATKYLVRGQKKAMEIALKDAGLTSFDVGYINAHATGTIVGNNTEWNAISAVFSSENNNNKFNENLYVSSTKGATGHLLGVSGALESGIVLQVINNSRIPLTMNLSQKKSVFTRTNYKIPKSRFVSPVMGNSWVERPIKFAMSNSFGFVGTKVSLLFFRYKD